MASFKKITQLTPADPSAYVNLAIAESAVGHPDDAEKHFRQAVAVGSHSTSAYLNLANWYRQQRLLPEAEAVLREGQSNIPDNTEIYLNLADTLSAEGKEELAESVLTSLGQRQPNSLQTELAIADYYAARGNWGSAESACRRALALAPGKAEVRQRLVELALYRADLKSAAALNDQILKEDPNNLASHIARARIMLVQGKGDEALTELRQQIAIAPNNPQVHYFLGVASWRAGNPNQAESAFRRALELDPFMVPALHSMAELEVSQGEHHSAIEPASRCVTLRPSDPSQRILLGKAYLVEGDFAQAREQFTFAQELNSHGPAAHDSTVQIYLALCSEGERKLDEARAGLEKAFQTDPQSIPALTKLVELDLQSQQRSKAIDRVRAFLGAYPNSAQAHSILGSLYARGAEYSAAQSEFERVIQIEPNLLPAYLALGRICQQTGQIDLALNHYRSALALQPRFTPLITLVGNLYLEKGDFSSAEKYFEEALAIDPGFAVAASNLAWVYAEQGVKLDLALHLARGAVSQLGELDSASDTLGWVEYRNGQFSSALPLFQECVRKVPTHPVYRYHLGLALLASGQKEKGRGELNTALRLNLAGAEAARARQTLAQLQ